MAEQGVESPEGRMWCPPCIMLDINVIIYAAPLSAEIFNVPWKYCSGMGMCIAWLKLFAFRKTTPPPTTKKKKKKRRKRKKKKNSDYQIIFSMHAGISSHLAKQQQQQWIYHGSLIE